MREDGPKNSKHKGKEENDEKLKAYIIQKRISNQGNLKGEICHDSHLTVTYEMNYCTF